MGFATVNGLVEFLEVDTLSDLESEFPFKDEVLPTVLLLSAIIRHARNDLNTRAYHRSGCCYYRGIMFEYHIELLQACFAVSGLPCEGINTRNARREAENLLGLEPGYLDPQYTKKLSAPGAAASAATDLYRIAAKNKAIAEHVLQQHMPSLLEESACHLPSEDEIDWLEHQFERCKFGIDLTGEQESEWPYDPSVNHDTLKCEHEWLEGFSPEKQMDLWQH